MHLLFLVNALALAQPVEFDRTIRLTHTPSIQSQQELATVIRSIIEIRQLTVDPAERQISMRATGEQIAAAEWIAARLDTVSDGKQQEYQLPAGGERFVRIFYVTHVDTTQKLQEAATAVRATVRVRRLFTYPSRQAIVVRGTESEILMSAWLLDRLDRPAAQNGRQEYAVGEAEVMRAFYLTTADLPQKLQEMATVVRSTGQIRQVFTYNALRTILLRGTPGQMALAEWMIGRLDRASAGTAVADSYRMPGEGDVSVRLFYLPETAPVERLQEVAVQIRSSAQVPSIFTYNSLRAISVRGSSGQLAAAQEIVEQASR